MQLSGSRSACARPVSRRTAVRVCATHRVDRSKKSDIIVSPSILSANFATLGAEVRYRADAPRIAVAVA